MSRTVAEVLAGEARWAVEQADAIAWLNSLPEGSLDLLFCSPPYQKCRLYLEDGQNLGIARDTEEWVAWMVQVAHTARRACKGLCAFVVEGQTRNYRYSCSPFLLVADLHRAGFHMRKLPIFYRVGIPGSGGPDWLRNDYEPIVCFSRPGKLPWSNNTAMGHAPKWAPGGEMSHRLSSGARVNAHGCNRRGEGVGGRRRNGKKKSDENGQRHSRPHTKRAPDGEMREQIYIPPALANPGNVIIDSLTTSEVVAIMEHYDKTTSTDSRSSLPGLRRSLETQSVTFWFKGVCLTVLGQEILRPELFLQFSLQGAERGQEVPDLCRTTGEEDLPQRQPGECGRLPEEEALQPDLPGQNDDGWRGDQQGHLPQARQGEGEQEELFALRQAHEIARPPQRRQPDKQRPGQPSGSVPSLPHADASRAAEVQGVWRSGEGAALLRQALPQIQEAWRSIAEVFRQRQAAEGSGLIRCNVGGGRMGSEFSHDNEAPFPEYLVEYMIRTFCPPGGLVGDCFSGSGTTVAVAVRTGRRGIGCDLRPSQVELSRKRIATETPPLPGVEV